MHYQPQFTLRNRELVGIEALLRWNHPKRGILGPKEFLSVAQELGIMPKLGSWVIQQVCKDFSENSELLDSVRIGINLAADEIQTPSLVRQVYEALSSASLPENTLELEVTEGSLMLQSERSLQALEELQHSGVRICLDDFGKGFSSLRLLQKWPIERVKIAGSTIQSLSSSGVDSAMVRAIISSAHNFGLEVIAAGVETEEQLELLRQFDCDQVQGYLFSPPRPLLEILKMMEFQQVSNLLVGDEQTLSPA